jgi:hypothetical protein
MLRATLLVMAVVLAAPAAGLSSVASALPGTTSKADRLAWQSLLHLPKSCVQTWQAQPNDYGTPMGAGVGVYSSASGTLAVVTCEDFAYQESFLLYLLNSAHHVTGPISLHTYDTVGDGALPTLARETLILGTYGFKAPRTLTILLLGVGNGSCGIWSVFNLTGDRFVPVIARAENVCDAATTPRNPNDWPLLPAVNGS